MKKLSVLILGSVLSASVLAAPAEKAFTGATVGAEVGTTKYKVKGDSEGFKSKNTTDANLKGGYGFEYGDSGFVGEVEGKVKAGSSKAFTYGDTDVSLKEKTRYSVGYAQGYRVTSDLMPYAKVEYREARFSNGNVKDTARGVGVGVGAKYAVMPNVELGVEYMNSQLRGKKDEDGYRMKLRGNSVNAGVNYRF